MADKVRPAGAKGFTLLEVMIALAIIGSALLVIIHTVNYHANIMYENTVTTQIYQLAKEKIHELEKTPQNSMGEISSTGFKYLNSAIRKKDSDIVELTAVVSGRGKQVMLKKLIIKKETPN